MSKTVVALIAAASGAIVGAAAMALYFKRKGLGLVAGGITDKFFGEGSTAGKIAAGIGDALQGLS